MTLVIHEPLTRSPHVRETYTQDGAVLLDPFRGQCFTINPVAAVIWRQLGEGRTLQQIADNISNTCNVPLEQAHGDVLDFVASLVDQKLVSQYSGEERTQRRAGGWKRFFGGLWRSR